VSEAAGGFEKLAKAGYTDASGRGKVKLGKARKMLAGAGENDER